MVSPAVWMEAGDGSDAKLGSGESSKCWAVAASANYLGVERPVLQYAVK